MTTRLYGGLLGSVFAFLLGVVVLVRGWGQLAAFVLGIGLTGLTNGDLPAWAVDQPWTLAFVIASIITETASGLALLSFVPLLYAHHVRHPGHIAALVTAIPVLGFWALGIYFAWRAYWVIPSPANSTPAFFAAAAAAFGMCIWWAWRGYREAPPPGHNRFAALFVAYAILLLSLVINIVGGAVGFTAQSAPILPLVIDLLGSAVFPLILVYAVLRHRVVDVSFALNRTVVYGTVSAILLGAFGLIEWGVEHLLPEEWVKASAWIDAGAAVLVYLAFHRVHDAVEQRVEHLFFHQWQANEDALRRFVASAAHFEDEAALARGFAKELARFGGGAQVALYRREAGALNRLAGSWDGAPPQFPDDDPAFALMRAERRPLDLSETPTDLPGVLALPMIDHGTLAGLVLMDLKGNAALYRPDEVTLLGWAAHEVGLALAALHARATDAEVDRLKIQIAELRSLVGDWREKAEA